MLLVVRVLQVSQCAFFLPLDSMRLVDLRLFVWEMTQLLLQVMLLQQLRQLIQRLVINGKVGHLEVLSQIFQERLRSHMMLLHYQQRLHLGESPMLDLGQKYARWQGM